MNRADHCPFENACREGTGRASCRLKPAADGEVLFVVELKDPACPYAMWFGDGQVGTCPERRRMFSRREARAGGLW